MGRLEELLVHLANHELTPEQTHQVTWNSLPRMTLGLLKLQLPTTALYDRLQEYCQHVLRTTVEMLRGAERYEIVECASRVLTDADAYPIYNPEGGVREGDSSDGGSGSDLSVDDAADGRAAAQGGGGGGHGGHGGHILSSAAPLDDFSAYYLQNIEYFHRLGGFTAILERIGREPRVHFNGVRLILRPFKQVKSLLSRHAM